jgi:hypothetical protein
MARKPAVERRPGVLRRVNMPPVGATGDSSARRRVLRA